MQRLKLDAHWAGIAGSDTFWRRHVVGMTVAYARACPSLHPPRGQRHGASNCGGTLHGKIEGPTRYKRPRRENQRVTGKPSPIPQKGGVSELPHGVIAGRMTPILRALGRQVSGETCHRLLLHDLLTCSCLLCVVPASRKAWGVLQAHLTRRWSCPFCHRVKPSISVSARRPIQIWRQMRSEMSDEMKTDEVQTNERFADSGHSGGEGRTGSFPSTIDHAAVGSARTYACALRFQAVQSCHIRV